MILDKWKSLIEEAVEGLGLKGQNHLLQKLLRRIFFRPRSSSIIRFMFLDPILVMFGGMASMIDFDSLPDPSALSSPSSTLGERDKAEYMFIILSLSGSLEYCGDGGFIRKGDKGSGYMKFEGPLGERVCLFAICKIDRTSEEFETTFGSDGGVEGGDAATVTPSVELEASAIESDPKSCAVSALRTFEPKRNLLR